MSLFLIFWQDTGTGTWSASSKLAVIFPGFSFVTGPVLCNNQRFFLSRVLLLGFGKLFSIKKKCHCRCCDVRGFYHELSKYVTIKVACARHSPIAFFTRHDPHISTSRCVYITGFFTMKLTSRHAHSYGRTQSGVIQHLAQTRASKMTSKFTLSSNLHSLLSPDLSVKFNVLSFFFRRM